MFYVDTSAIVTILTNEAEVPTVEAWFSQHRASRFAVSDWTITEISSALALKRRTGQISAEKHQAALDEVALMFQKSFRIFRIDRGDFDKAAIYCNRQETGLRAGDALHLAVAMKLEAELVTLDRRFATAAATLGAACTLL